MDGKPYQMGPSGRTAADLTKEAGGPAGDEANLLAGIFNPLYTVAGVRVLRLLNLRDRRSLVRAARGVVPGGNLEVMYEDAGLRDPGQAMATSPELTALVLRTAAEPDGAEELLPLALAPLADDEILGATDADLERLLEDRRKKPKPLGPHLLDLGDGYEEPAQFDPIRSSLALPGGGKLVAAFSPEHRDPGNQLDDSFVLVTAMLGPGGETKWVAENIHEEVEWGGAVGHPFADVAEGVYVSVWEDLCLPGYFDVAAYDADGNALGDRVFNLVDFDARETPFCLVGGVLFSATAVDCAKVVFLCSWDPRGEPPDEDVDVDDFVELELPSPFASLDLRAVEAARLDSHRFAVALYGSEQGSSTLAVMVFLVDRRLKSWTEVDSFKLPGFTYRGRNRGRLHLADRQLPAGGHQMVALTLSCLDGRTDRAACRGLAERGKAAELFGAPPEQADPAKEPPPN